MKSEIGTSLFVFELAEALKFYIGWGDTKEEGHHHAILNEKGVG